MIEGLAAIVKLLLYVGCVSAAGAAFARASLGRRLGEAARPERAIVLAGGVLAVLGALANVFVLLLRLGGDFSAPVLSTVLEGPTGLAAGMQVAGGVLAIAFHAAGGVLSLGKIAGGALLAASFAVNGHAPAADPVWGFVAGLHVAAAAWWVGSLLLLGNAAATVASAQLSALVRRFSLMAIAVVAALLAAGAGLVLTLVDFAHSPWLSPYGQALAVKVALVCGALGLAAFNKFALTPRLAVEGEVATRALRRSIMFETAFIICVLVATAVLTTYTSPHAHT